MPLLMVTYYPAIFSDGFRKLVLRKTLSVRCYEHNNIIIVEVITILLKSINLTHTICIELYCGPVQCTIVMRSVLCNSNIMVASSYDYYVRYNCVDNVWCRAG